MTWQNPLRWLLTALLSLLRSHQGIHFRASSLAKRWPRAYVSLRNWLVRAPSGTSAANMAEQKPWGGEGVTLPVLAPLHACSSLTEVAQRRLQRALWQRPRC